MLTRLIVLLGVWCFALPTGTEAQNLIGEVLCGPQQEIHAKLTRQFDVEKVGGGLRGPEAMLEIWTNARNGDWVLVQSYVEGRSCILAMGEYWEMRPLDTEDARSAAPETAG